MTYYDEFMEATKEAREGFINSKGFKLFASEMAANRQFYALFLRETYHLSRHTSRFLSAVVANLEDVDDEIRTRFMHHAIEEDGHHKFCLKDIVNIGYPTEFITNSKPLAGTTAVVAYHYYLAHYGNPIAMMGGVMVFEGLAEAIAGELADNLREQHQIPLSGVTFLHTHGKFDIEHMEEAREVMNTLIHREEDKADIIETAIKMYRFYSLNFEDMIKLSQESPPPQAAQAS